jgi:hypothetical protein
MHLIADADHNERFGQQIYQCDDCLCMVRFSLKKRPGSQLLRL